MTRTREATVESLVAKILTKHDVAFERSPAVAGYRPDFVAYAPGGERVLIEAKAWHPREGNTARALNQAERLRELTDPSRAFVVLMDLDRSFRARGVLNPAGLESLAASWGKSRPKRAAKRARASQPVGPVVFAAMPFEATYDDTYLVAMTYAAAKAGGVCTRLDRSEFTTGVVAEMRAQIRQAKAVIVDASESNPNVLYEAGYAQALGKPTVFICSTSLKELPFDVRDINTLPYVLGQTTALKVPLARRLRAALAGK